MAGAEIRYGGLVYNNASTNWAARAASIPDAASEFAYVPIATGGAVSVSTFLGGVVATLSGAQQYFAETGTVSIPRPVKARVKVPTVIMAAPYDNVTFIGGVRQFVYDYNSNVNIGLASANKLDVLISVPTAPYWFVQDPTAPAMLGTTHAYYPLTNYLLVSSLLMYGANTDTLLTGAKFDAGITYTDSMINGSNVISTYPRVKYYLDNNIAG